LFPVGGSPNTWRHPDEIKKRWNKKGWSGRGGYCGTQQTRNGGSPTSWSAQNPWRGKDTPKKKGGSKKKAYSTKSKKGKERDGGGRARNSGRGCKEGSSARVTDKMWWNGKACKRGKERRVTPEKKWVGTAIRQRTREEREVERRVKEKKSNRLETPKIKAEARTNNRPHPNKEFPEVGKSTGGWRGKGNSQHKDLRETGVEPKTESITRKRKMRWEGGGKMRERKMLKVPSRYVSPAG